MPGNRKESVNYMEYNTKTAAEDLLARMMVCNKIKMSEKYILNNMDKFRSAIVIQGMIKNDMIVGYTNQKVYDVYCGIAHEMNINPMSKIDFSRTLCLYYDFECKVTRVCGEVKKVFFQSDDNADKSIRMEETRSQVRYVSNIMTIDNIIGHQNVELYDQYVTWCKENDLPIGSKIAFSKIICSLFNVQTVVKRIGGKQARVYESLEGDGKVANLLCV